jgi:alanyl-tRNA synthetase
MKTGCAVEVFDLSDSRGIPFDIIALTLKEKGLVPDWQDFMRKAIRQLWTPKKIWQAAEELARPLGFWEQPEFQEKLKFIFVLEMRRIK